MAKKKERHRIVFTGCNAENDTCKTKTKTKHQGRAKTSVTLQHEHKIFLCGVDERERETGLDFRRWRRRKGPIFAKHPAAAARDERISSESTITSPKLLRGAK